MQSHLHNCVYKLNRVSHLYDYSIQYLSPYRIGKVRALYQQMVALVNTELGIIDFDSNSYDHFFGANKNLDAILQNKIKAIKEMDYELAAHLRDKERVLIISLLSEFGVNSSTKFFVRGKQIYQIK